jgi:hypothetical protein
MAGYDAAQYDVNTYDESASSASYAFNPVAAQSVQSLKLVSVTATLTTGSATPDSYSWSLQPNTDVHTLPLVATGSSVSFVSPGRMNGCTVALQVKAISGGVVVASTVATVTVGKHADFIYSGGKWVAITAPYVLHVNTGTADVVVTANTNNTATLTGTGVTANNDNTYTVTGAGVTQNNDNTYTIRG